MLKFCREASLQPVWAKPRANSNLDMRGYRIDESYTAKKRPESMLNHRVMPERTNGHFPERRLHSPEGSRVILAHEPDGTGVIFIHGYRGHSTGTWAQFDTLLPGSDAAKRADLYFYQFDGLRSNVIAGASIFKAFLSDLRSNPSLIVNDSLPECAHRSSSFAYQRITIIAHSLGAVIAR